MDSLRVLSFNCHGYNLGTQAYLSRVSEHYDIILLQETWLSDCTCYKLDFFLTTFWFTITLQCKVKSCLA